MKTLIVSLIVFSFWACREDPPPVISTQWLQHPSITGDLKIITDANTDGKLFFFRTMDKFCQMEPSGKLSFMNEGVTLNPVEMHPLIHINIDNNKKGFIITPNRFQRGNSIHLSISALDSTFESIQQIEFNQSGELIVVLKTKAAIAQHWKAFLVKFDLDTVFGDLKGSKPLMTDPLKFISNGTMGAWARNYKNNFYIQVSDYSGNSIYLVESDKGNVYSKKLDWQTGLSEIVEYNQSAHYIYYNSVSTLMDAGSSLVPRYISNEAISSYRFKAIQGKILAFSDYQLYELVLDGTSARLLAIDMAGMENDRITSVNFFNDQLFVSTMSGLFYKPWNKIFK